MTDKKEDFNCDISARIWLREELEQHKWWWEGNMGFMSCSRIKKNIDKYLEALTLIEERITELETDLEALTDY